MRRIEFDPGQTEEEARAEQRRQIQKLRPVYNKVFVQPDTEMSQPYRHKETSVFLLDYHIIFCPKRRRPVLEGALKVRLEEVIRNVASEIDAEVLALQIMPDHVHLFVSGVPQMAPNQIAGRFSRVQALEYSAKSSRTCSDCQASGLAPPLSVRREMFPLARYKSTSKHRANDEAGLRLQATAKPHSTGEA